jgi:oxygen-independent coproporphyrinogen III oxidase
MMAPLPGDAPVGVYLHIPFCAHICPYCDFNTYQGMDDLIPRYVDAVCADIDQFSESFGRLAAATIYIGGGTPSLLEPADVGRILDRVRIAFAVAAEAEITLEANPNSVDETYFAGLREAGVDRLSIGTQTFDRRGLRVLGRLHEAEDAVEAVAAARQAGFENISVDLIYGWPEQSVDVWRRDLERVLDPRVAPDHLSLYSLIVEPGTAMADAVRRGVLVPVGEDEAADFYVLAIEALADAGWTHYEISNWARTPDFASRHNTLYWRNGAYAGFGAGAHWRIGDTRRMNHLHPRSYIASVARGEPPVSNVETITPEIERGETMMLGLRLLREGVTAEEFAARHDAGLLDTYGAQIEELAALGMLRWDGHRLTLTQRGALVANEVCLRFLA